MNARQKAKYYKKRFEEYKELIIPTNTIYRHSDNLDHLVANSRIAPDIVEYASEEQLMSMHISRIADQLEKDVIPNYIDISKDKGIARFHLWVRRQ